ncbi:MAG: hypothetical protein J6Q17_08815 [Clostridia bacterium]|nr:hypothetical protein [Clostridia bacterium]
METYQRDGEKQDKAKRIEEHGILRLRGPARRLAGSGKVRSNPRRF